MKVKLTKEHVERAMAINALEISGFCPVWQALKDAGFKNHKVNYSCVLTPNSRFYLSPNAQAITALFSGNWSTIEPTEFEISPIQTEEPV